jgi:hypothetical protein
VDAVFVVVIGQGRGGGGVPDPPDPNDDDGGGGPTTTSNGPAVVGGNVEVSSSLAMGGAMGGVMSCLCVRCWVSLIRWHNICMVCFCIPHPRQFFYGRMNVGIAIPPARRRRKEEASVQQ